MKPNYYPPGITFEGREEFERFFPPLSAIATAHGEEVLGKCLMKLSEAPTDADPEQTKITAFTVDHQLTNILCTSSRLTQAERAELTKLQADVVSKTVYRSEVERARNAKDVWNFRSTRNR